MLRVPRPFGVKSLIVQLYGEPIGTPTHAEHCPHQREAKTRGMALIGVLLEEIFTATDDANDIYSSSWPGRGCLSGELMSSSAVFCVSKVHKLSIITEISY